MDNQSQAYRFFYELNPYNDLAYKNDVGIDGANLQALFNPTPKTILNLTALACRNTVSVAQKESLEEIYFNSLRVDKLKYSMVREMALFRYCIIEIIRREDKDLALKVIDGRKIKKLERDSGIITRLDLADGRKYELDESGVYLLDGKQLEGWQELPFVLIETDYDITNLITMTNDINQKRSWLKNIFKMHGNAILQFPEKPSKENEVRQNDGMKALVMPDAIRFVEMTGNIAKLMKEEVADLMNQVNDEHPEYNLSKILAGSGVSENTSKIKLLEIESKIARLRSELEDGIVEIVRKAMIFDGKVMGELDIVFEEIWPQGIEYQGESALVTVYQGYKQMGDKKLFDEFRDRNKMPAFTDEEWQGFYKATSL